jgi:hypothetical protein
VYLSVPYGFKVCFFFFFLLLLLLLLYLDGLGHQASSHSELINKYA